MMSLVSAIKEFISGSKDELNALQQQNAALQKQLGLSNDANATLEKKIKGLGDLEGKVESLTKQNSALQKQLDDEKNANMLLEGKVHQLDELQAQATSLERERDEALDLIKQAELDAKATKPKAKSAKKKSTKSAS